MWHNLSFRLKTSQMPNKMALDKDFTNNQITTVKHISLWFSTTHYEIVFLSLCCGCVAASCRTCRIICFLWCVVSFLLHKCSFRLETSSLFWLMGLWWLLLSCHGCSLAKLTVDSWLIWWYSANSMMGCKNCTEIN